MAAASTVVTTASDGLGFVTVRDGTAETVNVTLLADGTNGSDNFGAGADDTVAIDFVTNIDPSVSSAANSSFGVGDPASAIATITVTDSPVVANIDTVNDLRIQIPTGLDPLFDTTVSEADFAVSGGVTLAAFSSTTGGDTADDADIYLTFTDGVLDTDATPTSQYTAGTLTDLIGNALAPDGAPVASTDLTAPTITARQTIDNDGNGQLDRLRLTFSEPISDASVTFGDFAVTGYTVTGFVTGATADDAVFVILIDEGVVPDTNATPAVNFVSNTNLKDAGGTAPLIAWPTVTPTDGAAGRISVTLAVAGKSRVYIRFSEPLYGQIGPNLPVDAADLVVTGAGAVIAITPLVTAPDGGILEAFLTLSAALTANQAVTATIEVAVAAVSDATGNVSTVIPHPITNVALKVMEPVWAADGVLFDGSSFGAAIRAFDGSERLHDRDLTVQADILAPTLSAAPTAIYFDANVPGSLTPAGIWLPAALPGLVPRANTKARSAAPVLTNGALRDFRIPASDPEMVAGTTIEFLFDLGPLYAARVVDEDDPRTVET